MKILILDTTLGLELARRLRAEGHEIKYYLTWKGYDIPPVIKEFQNPLSEKLGIEFIEHYEEHINWPDLVITTDVVFGGEWELFHKLGIPIIGGPDVAYKLEIDRDLGFELGKEVGFDIPPYYDFESVEEAIDFVSQNPKPYVIRLGGIDITGIKRTNLCLTPESVIDILHKIVNAPVEKITLQEIIQGFEIAVGGYFNGEEFLLKNINYEFKKLFPGDLGPLTGDMGSVISYPSQHPLYEYLEKAKDKLKDLGYRGYFDFNTIYQPEEKKFYLLEPTVRFGFPTEYAQHSIISDYGSFLYEIATGEITRNWLPQYPYAVAVSYAVKGYGIVAPEASYVVGGLTLDEILDNKYYFSDSFIAIEEVKLDDELELLKTFQYGAGRAIHGIGKGEDLISARAKAYEALSKIYIQDGYYRIDIGDRVFEKPQEI